MGCERNRKIFEIHERNASKFERVQVWKFVIIKLPFQRDHQQSSGWQ